MSNKNQSNMTPKEREEFLLDYLLNKKGYDKLTTAVLMAHAKHESAYFKTMREYGNVDYFDKYEPNTRIGKMLGNTQRGDGYKFRGRGYVQITGRNWYTKIQESTGIPILDRPELAEHEPIAAEIFDWYIKNGNRFKDGTNTLYYAKRGDMRTTTKLINGGYNGYDDRVKLFNEYKRKFGI